MDSSITPLRHGGLSLVQTTDFFYPLVEDPYMQGTFEIIVFFKYLIFLAVTKSSDRNFLVHFQTLFCKIGRVLFSRPYNFSLEKSISHNSYTYDVKIFSINSKLYDEVYHSTCNFFVINVSLLKSNF